MWYTATQQPLDLLRVRAENSVLTPDEQRVLDQLLAALDQQECSVLRSTFDCLARIEPTPG